MEDGISFSSSTGSENGNRSVPPTSHQPTASSIGHHKGAGSVGMLSPNRTATTTVTSVVGGMSKQKMAALADPLSAVRRNPKGGVYVNPTELKQAFEFFDVEGKGYITISDLKKRLGVFYQNLSLREYKFLMNNKQELTEQDLYNLLAHNELTNYDPVQEAFKIYDPHDTGYIDLDVFREILSNLGFGDITDQDIQTLIDTADVDGDGKVSLSDFRKMLPTSHIRDKK